MSATNTPTAAIIDYGMGNLFSVAQACRVAGMTPSLTTSRQDVAEADLVILPGVGAFGSAMDRLRALDLISALKDRVARGLPLMGICLGMQLLLDESHEFGRHTGLGIIAGTVERFESPREGDRELKVPHVGWNRICLPNGDRSRPDDANPWEGTPLAPVKDGEYMYFVHSYRCIPKERAVVLSTTRYGHIDFCSTLAQGPVFACQYHPERSGPPGLAIYRWLAQNARKNSGPA